VILWYCLSDQISALSKSCYYHVHELRCIRPYLDFKTASTIATSIVHSKLDYCISLYHNLPNHQHNRLQQIQNSLARAVVKAPKSSLVFANPDIRYPDIFVNFMATKNPDMLK